MDVVCPPLVVVVVVLAAKCGVAVRIHCRCAKHPPPRPQDHVSRALQGGRLLPSSLQLLVVVVVGVVLRVR